MQKNLNALYILHSITALAFSLVGIFVPAYLITLGYEPKDVFIYFFTFAISIFVFLFSAGLAAQRTGIRIMIIASLPATLAYTAMLYLLRTTPIPLPLIAVVQGASAGLYWFALHLFFATNAKTETLGTSTGKLFGFPQMAALLGPLIGGLVAVRFGFPMLLILAECIFLLSAIPLFWLPELTVNATFRFSTFADLFKQFRRYTFTEFFENIREELEGTMWPLFVFLLFRNALSVGIVGTFAAIGSIMFTLFVGRYTDRINPKIFMRIGAILMAGIWLLRFLWPDASLLIYASTIAVGLLGSFIVIPLTSYVYQSAKRTNIAEFIVYREFPITFARIVIYGVALLIATKITNLFLIGAAASAFILLF